jgi:cobaltochelatase CobN
VPRRKLGRPRVDVVLSATGLYRDHFPERDETTGQGGAAGRPASEADNPLAANSQRIAATC